MSAPWSELASTTGSSKKGLHCKQSSALLARLNEAVPAQLMGTTLYWTLSQHTVASVQDRPFGGGRGRPVGGGCDRPTGSW